MAGKGNVVAAGAPLHPVQTLKEHVVALDAAMLVAVTAAEVGAVHKLRTGTRRVEAQMRMLQVLATGPHAAGLATAEKEKKAVERRLRRVRRAAGAVRDLDVQTEIIRYDMPAKAAVHEGTPGDAVRKQAKALRKHLQARREDEAGRLVATLKAEDLKLAAALQSLENALDAASSTAVSPQDMQQRLQGWFTQQAGPLLFPKRRGRKGPVPSEDLRLAVGRLGSASLHALRKCAKLCRYIAESAPDDAVLRGTAERYEAVQEAGGKWHDWLLLTQLSSRFHGRRTEITERYRKHRDAALAEYRLRLADLLPTLMG